MARSYVTNSKLIQRRLSSFEGSGGYDPKWVGRPEHVELQRIFLTHQMAQEASFLALAALRDAPAVVLWDRGCLDGYTFCSSEEWASVLGGASVTEQELHERYDLVVHMVTTAVRREPNTQQHQQRRGAGPGPAATAPWNTSALCTQG